MLCRLFSGVLTGRTGGNCPAYGRWERGNGGQSHETPQAQFEPPLAVAGTRRRAGEGPRAVVSKVLPLARRGIGSAGGPPGARGRAQRALLPTLPLSIPRPEAGIGAATRSRPINPQDGAPRCGAAPSPLGRFSASRNPHSRLAWLRLACRRTAWVRNLVWDAAARRDAWPTKPHCPCRGGTPCGPAPPPWGWLRCRPRTIEALP